MATPTIFPGMIIDIENRILNFMSEQPRSLVDLSGTCEVAYKKLSNGKYFEPLFAMQHPLLAKTDQVFLQLRTYYLNCHWKAASCLMLEDCTSFKKEFLERPILEITAAFQSLKEQIHLGWEECAKDEEELKAFRLQKENRIKNALAPLEHSIAYISTHFQFDPHTDPQRIPNEVKIKVATHHFIDLLTQPIVADLLCSDVTAIAEHEMAPLFDLNKIEKYREAVTILLEIKRNEETLSKKLEASKLKFSHLEFQRGFNVKAAEKCSVKLLNLESNLAEVWRANQLDLLVDQCFARNAEKFAANALTLFRTGYMCNLLQNELSQNKGTEFLRKFIDSFVKHFKDSQLVCEILDQHFGDKVLESQWLEKNGDDFIEILVVVMSKLRAQTESFIPVYFRNLDLKVFVDANCDVSNKDQFKVELSSLKEIKDALNENPMKAFPELDVIDGTQCGPHAPMFQNLSEPLINLLFSANSVKELLPTITSLISHMEQLQEESLNLTENLVSKDTSA